LISVPPLLIKKRNYLGYKRPSSPSPLYLKTREIDRHPLDARHRGEARVISATQQVKLESSVGTVDPE